MPNYRKHIFLSIIAAIICSIGFKFFNKNPQPLKPVNVSDEIVIKPNNDYSKSVENSCTHIEQLLQFEKDFDSILQINDNPEKLIQELNLFNSKLKKYTLKNFCQSHLDFLINIENKKLKIFTDNYLTIASKRKYYKAIADLTPVMSPNESYIFFLNKTNENRVNAIDAITKSVYRFGTSNFEPKMPNLPIYEWPDKETYILANKTIFNAIRKYRGNWDYMDSVFQFLEPIDKDLYEKYNFLLKDADLTPKLAILSNQINYDIENDLATDAEIQKRIKVFLDLVIKNFPIEDYGDLPKDLSKKPVQNKKFLVSRVTGFLNWLWNKREYDEYKNKFKEVIKLNMENRNIVTWGPIINDMEQTFINEKNKVILSKKNRKEIVPELEELFEFHTNNIMNLKILFEKNNESIYEILDYIAYWRNNSRKSVLEIFPTNYKIKESNFLYKNLLLPISRDEKIKKYEAWLLGYIIQEWAINIYKEVIEKELVDNYQNLSDQFIEISTYLSKKEPSTNDEESLKRTIILLNNYALTLKEKRNSYSIPSNAINKSEHLTNKIGVALLAVNDVKGNIEANLLSISSKLQNCDNFNLLDREYITKTKQEHNLTALSEYNKEESILLGRLLRADLIVLISKTTQKEDQFIVKVIHTNLGIRLFKKKYFISDFHNLIDDLNSLTPLINNKKEVNESVILNIGVVGFSCTNKNNNALEIKENIEILLDQQLNKTDFVFMKEFVNFKNIRDENLLHNINYSNVKLDNFIFGNLEFLEESIKIKINMFDKSLNSFEKEFIVEPTNLESSAKQIAEYILSYNTYSKKEMLSNTDKQFKKLMELGQLYEKKKDFALANDFFQSAYYLNPLRISKK